jgi:heme A synthase
MKELIQGFLGGIGFILASQALHYAPVLIQFGGAIIIFALFALLVLRVRRRW